VRSAEADGPEGARLDHAFALAHDLAADGRRAEAQRLARELLPEAERRGLTGMARGARAILAPG
jgi:hypothetical protein